MKRKGATPAISVAVIALVLALVTAAPSTAGKADYPAGLGFNVLWHVENAFCPDCGLLVGLVDCVEFTANRICSLIMGKCGTWELLTSEGSQQTFVATINSPGADWGGQGYAYITAASTEQLGPGGSFSGVVYSLGYGAKPTIRWNGAIIGQQNPLCAFLKLDDAGRSALMEELGIKPLQDQLRDLGLVD